MSHSGWSTSNYITLNGTKPSAVPLTLHARYKASAFTSTARLVSVYFDTSNAFRLCVTNGQKAFAQTAAGGTANAIGATSIGTGWVSLVARFTSATDRKIFLDGVQDATNATSTTPTGTTTATIGQDSGAFPALGSIAEVAIWNVALSDEDIVALVTCSPRLIRPDALLSQPPLLDNGTLDYFGPAATVTGTLTKDSDHPRVILPRQRSLIIPKSAGGGGEEQAVGSSAGTATAAATGQSTARASGTIAGTSTVAATGRSTAASVASAAGNSTAAATGTYTGEVQAVGTAAGTSTASAVGTSTGGVTQIGPADDRPARRKRRDRETLEAYYAALQRKANEDAEREKLEALAEAERALEEAETAKKAEAKRAAVRKVFAALDRAALTEKAKAGAREAEQAALEAITKRQTQEQREAYLDALDQLNVEIEMIGAQIARLYARRREEEQFLLQRWFAA